MNTTDRHHDFKCLSIFLDVCSLSNYHLRFPMSRGARNERGKLFQMLGTLLKQK